MGYRYRRLDTLPELYDIVGCKWPLDENKTVPGPVVRPCLVLQRKTLLDEDGTVYGTLVLSYGSSKQLDQYAHRDFLLKDFKDWKAADLHMATRFSMDRIAEFIWCEEWFPPHPYIVNRGVHIGQLTDEQVVQLKECLKCRPR